MPAARAQHDATGVYVFARPREMASRVSRIERQSSLFSALVCPRPGEAGSDNGIATVSAISSYVFYVRNRMSVDTRGMGRNGKRVTRKGVESGTPEEADLVRLEIQSKNREIRVLIPVLRKPGKVDYNGSAKNI